MATNLQDEAFHDGIGEVFHRSTLDWLNQPDLVAIYDRHHAIPLPLSIEKLGPGPIEEGIFLYARRRMRDYFEWDDVNQVRRRHCRPGRRPPPGGQVTHTEAILTMEDGHLFTRRNYHRGPNPFCLVHYLIRPPPVVNDESEDDGGGDEDESEDDGSGDEDESEDDGGGDEDESEDDGGGDEDESEDDGGGDEDESEDDGDAAEAGDGDAAEAGDGDAAEAGDGSEQDSTESEDDFKGDPDYDPNLDEQLDASNHSIGYLREEALTRDPVKKEKSFGVVLLIDRFINSCEALQIRFATEKFVTLCKDPVSAKCLTALHPDCLQLCLQAKCYEAGFSILSDDILEVDQPRDLYLYCYYGGMICIGLKRFQKASELLYNVVTAPMFQLNAIALEAYKKYILVTLIHSGQFSGSLPKCASTAAQRHLKSGCMPYHEVGNRYNDGKISELEAVAVAHNSDFEKDNNIGLVKQAVASLYKRNILRLTQKYLTLSLQDIAQKEAEMHVLQMIQEGQIHALINQKDGMVRFLEDPEQYKTSEMMIEVTDSVIQRTIGLSKNLLAMDESLSCDPLYLGKVGRERQKYDFGDGFDTVPQKFSM